MPVALTGFDEPLTDCPIGAITGYQAMLIQAAVRTVRHNFLPLAGGLEDQAPSFLPVLDFVREFADARAAESSG